MAVREGVLAMLDAPLPEVIVAEVREWGVFGGFYLAKIGVSRAWKGKKIIVGGTELSVLFLWRVACVYFVRGGIVCFHARRWGIGLSAVFLLSFFFSQSSSN